MIVSPVGDSRHCFVTGWALLLTVLALAGCVEVPKVPHHPMKGLWREAGHPTNYYLVVEPKDEGQRQRQPYAVYTNIQSLLNTRDEFGKLSDDDGPIGSFILTGRIARLETRTRGVNLERERHTGLTLWESYASYGLIVFIGNVLYPDGFPRLLIVFGLSITIAFVIFYSDEFYLNSFGVNILAFIMFLCLVFVIPFAIGYLVAGTKWLILGYWDPLIAGKTVIYLISAAVILSLFMSLSAIRTFKIETHSRFRGSFKVLIFWLLVGIDALGAAGSIRALYEWFR